MPDVKTVAYNLFGLVFEMIHILYVCYAVWA